MAVKLQPTPEQASALLATLQRANAAANSISRAAWHAHTFAQFKLQHPKQHPEFDLQPSKSGHQQQNVSVGHQHDEQTQP